MGCCFLPFSATLHSIQTGAFYMDTKKIGAFIASCRKAKGYTQQQLAEKMGVTNKTVSRWETGVSQTKGY